MKSLELGDVEDFPFLDPPHARSISEGYRVLSRSWAALGARELTPLERRRALPGRPGGIGRMILAGAEHDCLRGAR